MKKLEDVKKDVFEKLINHIESEILYNVAIGKTEYNSYIHNEFIDSVKIELEHSGYTFKVEDAANEELNKKGKRIVISLS